MSRSTPVFFAALICLSNLAFSQDVESRVRALAEPLIKAKRAMGISIGVISGEERFSVHLGKTGDGEEMPNDQTVYEIGSISKVFTGLMLADAVVGGNVRLDQPAGELLPDDVVMPTWNETQITLLQLSTHRSGLPRLPDNMTEVTSDNPYAGYTSKHMYEFLNAHTLGRAPGEKGEYSNFAVALLGHLICLNSERSYEQVLQEKNTGPLSMDSTAVELTDSMRFRMATPHDSGLNPTSNWEFADVPGAGGIRSSIEDMLKFAAANLNPPDGELGQAIELAWKQHQPSTGGSFAMGLGWHLARDGQTRWHNGGTGGYRTMLMINRPLQIAVVVLCNTACGEVDALAEQMVQMLAGAEVRPVTFADQTEVDVPVEKMKRLEGRYQLVPTFIFDVNVRDGKLMVGVTNQPTFQVFAKSETEWFYKVVPASLTFRLTESGECTALELFQNGIRQTAKRVDE
ncbi:serine hydrolase [Aporhodopirellula aestuarii]|uniref:Beta-lactamase n=1 Tax=Aporhodopirellula aestuarii TaxID=2950107 RepID=A0ABT0U5S4_9BACT|nr:serine hydrolase [Aporhodopirellula aestuarii]MCM2372258.1 serine hydrolase [Aporhodopirellula aestuarii]